jgi:D-glycerate 3-kinase
MIEQKQLPDSFEAIVRDIYLPLAQIILDKKQDKPLLVSINGAQGTGKSTLTAFLKKILESEHSCSATELSLDDFYYTRNERAQLSEKVHPLLITRGVPGTHDADLIESVLDAMMNRQPCKVPKFNKANDDRCNDVDWFDCKGPVDVILFEGWCNNAPVQNQKELAKPVNDLEANEDAEGIWRHYANEQLKDYHRRFFRHANMCIMLNASDFDHVYHWRSLQEKKLRLSSFLTQQHVMSEQELKRFIQHYERISRHALSYLPDIADIVLPFEKDHSIAGIIQKDISS